MAREAGARGVDKGGEVGGRAVPLGHARLRCFSERAKPRALEASMALAYGLNRLQKKSRSDHEATPQRLKSVLKMSY